MLSPYNQEKGRMFAVTSSTQYCPGGPSRVGRHRQEKKQHIGWKKDNTVPIFRQQDCRNS